MIDPELEQEAVRQAQAIYDSLRSGLGLPVEERIERLVVVKKTWREQMRREWEQLTGSRITRSTPRHSEEEIRRIFASLDHTKADPRIALALELGAEAHLGQVIRIMRSDIDLSKVGAFGLGRVRRRPSAGNFTPRVRAGRESPIEDSEGGLGGRP